MIQLPKIKFENKIHCKKINFPTNVSNQLAEEIGIHIGDGSMIVRPVQKHFDYYVCLSLEERDYKNYICSLMSSIYKIYPTHVKERIEDHSLTILYSSKLLVMWKVMLGLSIGKKCTIQIPEIILKSKFIFSCLRGIFDTDGSLTFKRKKKNGLHDYPVIKIDSESNPLILQIAEILKLANFSFSLELDQIRYRWNRKSILNTIYINGKNNLKKWMKIIGSSNSNHTTKYEIWNKFGFCPPKTSLEDRIKILHDVLDPYQFEK